MSLIGFWHGAAKLSGRIDLSSAIQCADDPSRLNDTELRNSGIAAHHLKTLRASEGLDKPGSHIVIGQPLYPRHLAELPFAPAVLFYRGDASLLQQKSVAIVGARQCTQRGREMAARLAHEVANAGLNICTGLAYGIDEAAQMVRPDRAIAVLGQGWGAPMSRRLKSCVSKILDAGGVVITEYTPHTHATRFTFPQRNRIISGVSLATIVVEASERSGSQITARHALEQGRDVLAVPGRPNDVKSTGCNRLIAQGAALIQNPTDALAVIGYSIQPKPHDTPSCETQNRVLHALKTGSTLDHISSTTREHIHDLMVALQSLELTGHVVRLPGDRFQLKETI